MISAVGVFVLNQYPSWVSWYRIHMLGKAQLFQENYNVSYWRRPSFWSRVLSTLLIGVNDTQLFTGTAVQIASLKQMCFISIYHYRIANQLAFLSTVTHLLTLVAMRSFFTENPWSNLSRVLIMILNLALLGYTSWIEYALDNLDQDSRKDKVACYLGPRSLPSTSTTRFRWIGLLLVACAAHGSVFWEMYVWPRLKHSGFGRVAIICVWLREYVVTPAYAIYGLVVGIRVLRYTQAFGSAPVVITGDEREWGFGQILAVFLLALTFLPGWETILG